MQYENSMISHFDPTFLFIWTGTRTCDEASYHSHEHIEMALILSGSGKYLIDGDYYDVTEGDLILFNPGVRHKAIVSEKKDHPATEFFVGFSDLTLNGYPENHFLLPDHPYVFHAGSELWQKLFRICRSMLAENEVCHEGRYYMLKTYLMQMLLLLIREQAEPMASHSCCSFESTSKKYVVEKLVSYFDDHYNEKISLDQIAGNMYLSPFYLSRIFKSEIGDSPIRYLINIRLEKAKALLENGWDGSIQEVASAVGYDDAYHFSKLFKKKFGIAPSRLK